MLAIILASFIAHPPIPTYEGPTSIECPATEAAELAARIADTSAEWMQAVIQTESRGVPTAIGDGGKSIGLFQIQLATCKSLYSRCKRADLLDPRFAPVIAGLIWRYLIKKVGRENAAIAYTCGHKCRRKNGTWYTHTKTSRGYFRRLGQYMDGSQCAADGCQ